MYPDVGVFFVACAIVTLFTNAAVSFGYLISCAAGSENMALALAPTLIVPLMLFGGFFLNSGTVPAYFLWLAVSCLGGPMFPRDSLSTTTILRCREDVFNLEFLLKFW